MFNLYNKKEFKVLPSIKADSNINNPELYIPSEGLINAVNVAIALAQPLLLTGEPGTGKTRLAYHIAHIFQLEKPIVFNAQTTSNAKDLFYRYDALGHFQFSQTSDTYLSNAEIEHKYISYQGLGEAIRDNKKCVVLIDEIDKAPRDLPNDVLAAIEDLSFFVTEINKSYTASPENRPLIIITSNSEKNLPDAFLRRVVFYHIPFPNSYQLFEILKLKVDGFPDSGIEHIIKHFEDLREEKKTKLKKKPATAELIYWAQLLQKLNFDPSNLTNSSSMSFSEKNALATSYSVLAKNKEDLESLKKLIA